MKSPRRKIIRQPCGASNATTHLIRLTLSPLHRNISPASSFSSRLMFLRPIVRSIWHPPYLSSLSSQVFRHISSRHNPPFPTVPTCPSPTCTCSPTPSMPQGLEIDHSKPLNATMAAYAEQVLICTGKDDWLSRIEDENSGDNLAADIKELLGRGGMYSDVCPPNTLFL